MKTQTYICSFVVVLLGAGLTAQADVVTDWNTAALGAIRIGRTPPPAASRNLALLHASIFDAVNGISRTHQAFAVPSAGPASANRDAAASAAAHRILTALYSNAALVTTFDHLHAATLAAVPNRPQKAAGVAWGVSVANQILALRASDGSSVIVAAPPSTEIGDWLPTPPAFAAFLLPQWGFVDPFCMTTSHQFRPPGPPALNTVKWAADYNEVKALGAAVGSIRTADQTQIALFWADGGGTETPPGHWNHIAQDVGAAQGNTMEENARLFALLNLAMADAGICAWDAKYTFNNWRPVTAIRNGDADGNPDTAPDSAWSSFIGTPPFPDYVSGHSTFSASAATVLAMFYGTDNIAFATGSDGLAGVTRSFTSFSGAAAEAAVSRIYGGIHFRFAADDGMSAGLSIGEWTFNNFLKAKGNRSRK
jgi:membrane-associated phospholipid phosphatase